MNFIFSWPKICQSDLPKLSLNSLASNGPFLWCLGDKQSAAKTRGKEFSASGAEGNATEQLTRNLVKETLKEENHTSEPSWSLGPVPSQNWIDDSHNGGGRVEEVHFRSYGRSPAALKQPCAWSGRYAVGGKVPRSPSPLSLPRLWDAPSFTYHLTAEGIQSRTVKQSPTNSQIHEQNNYYCFVKSSEITEVKPTNHQSRD